MPSQHLPSQESDDDVVEVPASSDSGVNFMSQLTQTENEQDDIAKPTLKSNLTDFIEAKDRKAFKELCDTFLTKDLTVLINTSYSFEYKKIKTENKIYKKEDTEDFLQYCFKLYQKSPQTYQFFQNLYGWPSIDILLKKHIQIGRVNDLYHSASILTLKARFDKMSTKEKNCSVLIEIVSLKANLCYNIKEDKIHGLGEVNGVQSTQPATKALVVMIRGLLSNWKQAVDYILLSINENESIVADWIDSLLKGLFQIGLNVRTLVSSTKDEFINRILYKRSVSIDSPFFFLDDRKIYLTFDAPDLINSIRDSMILNDFHFQNKVAKYEDIVKFYNVDQKKELPYAYKLTERHLEPGSSEKLEVKYAAQLMSKTVAHGLWNYMKFQLINDAQEGTVEFLANVNDLFDTLNVFKHNIMDENNERRKPFREESTHNEFLKTILLLFQCLKVINKKTGQDVTSMTRFISGVLITVKAIISLYDELKTEGHKILLTGNLQRKALDDFLKRVHLRIHTKPAKLTTMQFTTALRKNFLTDLKKFMQAGNSKGEVPKFTSEITKIDEEIDLDDTTYSNMLKLNSQLKISMLTREKASQQQIVSDDDKQIDKNDYNKINTQEKHSLFFICGLLLLKVRKLHNVCHIFKHYLYSSVYEPNLDIGKFQRYNRYKQTNAKSLLEVPSDDFIKFVEQMYETFTNIFAKKHLDPRIADTVLTKLESIEFNAPCPCFPKKYMMKLFIRIKIFYTIRLNNTEFKKNKRNYLTIPKLE